MRAFYCFIAAAPLLMIFVLSVQAFKPVVGKSLLSPVTPVEFLLDRQLDFLSDHSAYQPYQVTTLTPNYTRWPSRPQVFPLTFCQVCAFVNLLNKMTTPHKNGQIHLTTPPKLMHFSLVHPGGCWSQSQLTWGQAGYTLDKTPRFRIQYGSWGRPLCSRCICSFWIVNLTGIYLVVRVMRLCCVCVRLCVCLCVCVLQLNTACYIVLSWNTVFRSVSSRWEACVLHYQSSFCSNTETRPREREGRLIFFLVWSQSEVRSAVK